ncbi:protein kinase [Actinokineospora sp. PR83]|uniref:serine/threonine protein kinase n=1 Tax=Actinokineospora sp. PR83 TaxID=2884908 RepID=UPI001F1BF5C4|nr:protein kinase [Actinokineospora sp. PR83]MCG8918973.1 protein kinase [Actinokineospora sp. PR83]
MSDARQKVSKAFRGAGFEIVWVTEEGEGQRWGIYLKLPPFLKEIFHTTREVLVWVVESKEFQARSVTQVVAILDKERPRLCEDFAFVVTADPQTESYVNETASTLDTIMLGFSLEQISSFAKLDGAGLVSLVQSRLYRRDLYDLPTAVTRSEDFFGRKSAIVEIAKRLSLGGRHVGLFGLRKIGKTSLLYRLRSVLQSSSNYVVNLDLERVDAVNPSLGYLLWSLGESMCDSYPAHMRKLKNLELFGKYRLFSQVPAEFNMVELFDHDLRQVLTSNSRKVIFMLDEVELLSPEAPGSMWGTSFIKLWRLLRGLDQQFPNRLSYFVTGTNPSVFERNSIGGFENPAFNYIAVEYLKPLNFEEVSDLIRMLGMRMGLNWSNNAIQKVYDATGGHPALTRGLASIVNKSIPDRDGLHLVDLPQVQAAVKAIYVTRASLLSQLVAVIAEQYTDEYFLLELLADGRIGEFREFAKAFSADTAHLIGYGLCEDPERCTSLTIELLQTFIQRRKITRDKSSIAEKSDLGRGDEVGAYRIESSIGVPSGFASVYKARDTADGRDVALKVFKHGLLSSLQREIAPLQEINHPNVVKIVDFGTSEDGYVYLAMEYLAGPTLREFCGRSSRANEKLGRRWLVELLSALVSFHPDESKVQSIRAMSELSPEQLTELEEARHGFVHRDIKPENIILSDDRVVLIDFNISSRASSVVITESVTPGYSPPDGVGPEWTVDVDIYQLGITMLQVLLGVESLREIQFEDLHTLAREQLSTDLARILTKMTAAGRAQRYRSATEVLRALGHRSFGSGIV